MYMQMEPHEVSSIDNLYTDMAYLYVLDTDIKLMPIAKGIPQGTNYRMILLFVV